MSRSKENESHSQEAELRRVLNALDQVVIQLDADGMVRGVNSAAEQLLGLTPEQLSGKSLDQLLAPRLVPAHNYGTFAQSLGSTEKVCGEAIYDHPSGQRRLLRWCVTPLTNSNTSSGYVVTFCDLTPLQNAESNFVAVIEDFLSVIQHRLRTPVLANLRVNDLMLDGAFGPINEKQAEVLSAIGRNSSEIDRLLRILLDIYRYKNRRQHLQLQRRLISDSLKQTLADLKASCEQAKLQLEVIDEGAADSVHAAANSVHIQVDQTEIEKLFQHIGENAVRHARSSVIVRIGSSANKAFVSFEDDGKGISPEDISHLFTRFYQSSSRGRYAPATGAGLCLCWEIARAHGGSLSCKSRLNEGTRFTLTLPAC